MNGRPSPESLLRMMHESERAKLRVYIGAAAGVGKTYRMLQDAHQIKQQGVDVVIGIVETHGRFETTELIGDLETVPPKKIEYRGNIFDEMNVGMYTGPVANQNFIHGQTASFALLRKKS